MKLFLYAGELRSQCEEGKKKKKTLNCSEMSSFGEMIQTKEFEDRGSSTNSAIKCTCKGSGLILCMCFFK